MPNWRNQYLGMSHAEFEKMHGMTLEQWNAMPRPWEDEYDIDGMDKSQALIAEDRVPGWRILFYDGESDEIFATNKEAETAGRTHPAFWGTIYYRAPNNEEEYEAAMARKREAEAIRARIKAENNAE